MALKRKGWSFVLPGSIGAGVFASAKRSAMEEAMLHFSRSASIIGAPLALAAPLAWVTPAGAFAGTNLLGANGVAQTGIPPSARITTGSALGDLNGVAVEAVIISEAALR
jgi:hypothetical protein